MYFFKQHDWNFKMSRPFRSKVSVFVRQLGLVHFAVWVDQVVFYFALPKFIALVDRDSLQRSAYVGHDEFHRMNLQHIRRSAAVRYLLRDASTCSSSVQMNSRGIVLTIRSLI